MDMELKRVTVSSQGQQEDNGSAQMTSYCIIRSNKLHRKHCSSQDEKYKSCRLAKSAKWGMSMSQISTATEWSKEHNVEHFGDHVEAMLSSGGQARPGREAAAMSGRRFDEEEIHRAKQQDRSLKSPKCSTSRAAKLSTCQVKFRRSTNEFENERHPTLVQITRASANTKREQNSACSRLGLVVVLFCALSLIDWQAAAPGTQLEEIVKAPERRAQQQQLLQNNEINKLNGQRVSLVDGLFAMLVGPRRKSTALLASAQQYKPEWPHKSLEQEIFLLNLEDGYFGCQVNSSQDFLQLFELSRLCDGQAQCYLGTDELVGPLKCRNRERCDTSNGTSSSGQQEVVQCVNGVCLDGLCYCNDGYGGKSCDIPDENECKFRPCDVFAHCTNTMGSYYCSCFPGE